MPAISEGEAMLRELFIQACDTCENPHVRRIRSRWLRLFNGTLLDRYCPRCGRSYRDVYGPFGKWA